MEEFIMKKILIVVDMQKDFVDGVLGSAAAQAIVPKVAEKVKQYENMGDKAIIIYTQDTHDADTYFNTVEGKTLPIHCEKGKAGWEIIPEVVTKNSEFITYEKPSFGDLELPYAVIEEGFRKIDEIGSNQDIDYFETEGFESIEICGLCTGICVINAALNMRSMCPETKIIVDSSCCACVSKESHEAALKIMKNCMIEVI
jgi:nicotinamidase-related amidase